MLELIWRYEWPALSHTRICSFSSFYSLERMTLSLAADVLHNIPKELDIPSPNIFKLLVRALSSTSLIMQVYEEDIRTPITSAIRGTLIRGILVQVEKAKVCFSFFFYISESGIWNFTRP